MDHPPYVVHLYSSLVLVDSPRARQRTQAEYLRAEPLGQRRPLAPRDRDQRLGDGLLLRSAVFAASVAMHVQVLDVAGRVGHALLNITRRQAASSPSPTAGGPLAPYALTEYQSGTR